MQGTVSIWMAVAVAVAAAALAALAAVAEVVEATMPVVRAYVEAMAWPLLLLLGLMSAVALTRRLWNRMRRRGEPRPVNRWQLIRVGFFLGMGLVTLYQLFLIKDAMDDLTGADLDQFPVVAVLLWIARGLGVAAQLLAGPERLRRIPIFLAVAAAALGVAAILEHSWEAAALGWIVAAYGTASLAALHGHAFRSFGQRGGSEVEQKRQERAGGSALYGTCVLAFAMIEMFGSRLANGDGLSVLGVDLLASLPKSPQGTLVLGALVLVVAALDTAWILRRTYRPHREVGERIRDHVNTASRSYGHGPSAWAIGLLRWQAERIAARVLRRRRIFKEVRAFFRDPAFCASAVVSWTCGYALIPAFTGLEGYLEKDLRMDPGTAAGMLGSALVAGAVIAIAWPMLGRARPWRVALGAAVCMGAAYLVPGQTSTESEVGGPAAFVMLLLVDTGSSVAGSIFPPLVSEGRDSTIGAALHEIIKCAGALVCWGTTFTPWVDGWESQVATGSFALIAVVAVLVACKLIPPSRLLQQPMGKVVLSRRVRRAMADSDRTALVAALAELKRAESLESHVITAGVIDGQFTVEVRPNVEGDCSITLTPRWCALLRRGPWRLGEVHWNEPRSMPA